MNDAHSLEKLHTDVKERRLPQKHGSQKGFVFALLGQSISFLLKKMVGMGRLELPTSRLSVVRSSQLSYTPIEMNNSLHDFIKVCSFENWWRLADSNR